MFPEFKNLDGMKDEAPTLEDDGSGFSVDPSDDDASQEADFVTKFNKREAAHRKKEDEDVAMFLSLVEKMSVKSLVFLLQAHARTMHNVPESHLQQTLQQIENEQTGPKKTSKQVKSSVKNFRFALVMGGQKVREEVREIPHCSTFTEEDKAILWWSKREQRGMQKEAAKVVRFFRDHRPEYAQSVKIVANSFRPGSDGMIVEHHMKQLTNNSFPRGLECHIVSKLGHYRDDGVQSVIIEQEKFRARRARDSFFFQGSEEKKDVDADIDDMWDDIRIAYLAASTPCKTFAQKMAECDHVEALKASISRWNAGC
eukprot:CAMPEP_0172451552 /NCGR_PEP_ID=MMETSP1065-20121228/9553_1 /TAXON_ID=265537 /ORGANISM="Amphiprora paludosa, Strain CCMP125" /LENGTH=312 /DNA_ID=CAMNT_0013203515 /DNA_START=669 /DNA_END=1607 /DNA_ORIENTATION=+